MNRDYLDASYIQENYNKIMLKMRDGKWHRLKKQFTFCLTIKNSKKEVYLDTGGFSVMDRCSIVKMTEKAMFDTGDEKICDIKFKDRKNNI